MINFIARQNQRNRSATRKGGGGKQNNNRNVSNGSSMNLSQTGFNSQASQVSISSFLYCKTTESLDSLQFL